MIWYVFPIDQKISWEGHLSGLISGVVLSLFFKNELAAPEVKPLTFHQSLFLEHFDDNGMFIANLPFLDEDGNLTIADEEE